MICLTLMGRTVARASLSSRRFCNSRATRRGSRWAGLRGEGRELPGASAAARGTQPRERARPFESALRWMTERLLMAPGSGIFRP